MKKKKPILILCGVLFCALLFFIFGNPVIAKNESDFGKAVKAVQSETVVLNDIVPFEWDKVYTFAPYTTKQEIEKVIGFESNLITETVNEGMTQLLFVKENQVVCDICGYSDNLGYAVLFADDNAAPSRMIQYEDNAVFSVERRNDGIVITEKTE